MKIVKTILFYLIYTLLSISLSMLQIHLEIGSRPNSKFAGSLHDFIIISIGTVLGLITAILFFIINHFGLKSKIKELWKMIAIQIITLVIISLIIHKIHYFLEFGLDVI
ncbi:hypothetical protein FIA58_014215 [Flavobacterium jejuense]|uniref:Uncharacterized protein n=1 Tax=Flavobacterium jejuense TaxID=1544455 RepID=A0ABX0IUG4_9FLAO|nr:hypothetical protein [Flavobacterium jejuense]NHN26836.1 hypothetical protein [Flavobacterium jejuense]